MPPYGVQSMVKVREPKQPSLPKKAALSDAEKAAKAESFGNEAIPKLPRAKPFKAINIPFTEDDYNQLLAAAKSDNRLPTSFIKAAIKTAIDRRLAMEKPIN